MNIRPSTKKSPAIVEWSKEDEDRIAKVDSSYVLCATPFPKSLKLKNPDEEFLAKPDSDRK